VARINFYRLSHVQLVPAVFNLAVFRHMMAGDTAETKRSASVYGDMTQYPFFWGHTHYFAIRGGDVVLVNLTIHKYY
jgi:hypothetical protein